MSRIPSKDFDLSKVTYDPLTEDCITITDDTSRAGRTEKPGTTSDQVTKALSDYIDKFRSELREDQVPKHLRFKECPSAVPLSVRKVMFGSLMKTWDYEPWAWYVQVTDKTSKKPKFKYRVSKRDVFSGGSWQGDEWIPLQNTAEESEGRGTSEGDT